MSTPVWHGISGSTEQPRRYTYNASRNELLQTYKGGMANLIAAKPEIGSAVTGVSGYAVDMVEIVEDFASNATMTVKSALESPTIGGTPATPDPVYEIEWTQIEKKVEQHPIFASGGTYELSDADRDAIVEWEAETVASERTTKYTALSASAKILAGMKMVGTESYIVFSPVARLTSYSYEAPSTSACGQRQTPSGFPSLPSGYVWLQTADRGTRTGKSGKWERVQEWTGADVWDTRLYEEA